MPPYTRSSGSAAALRGSAPNQLAGSEPAAVAARVGDAPIARRILLWPVLALLVILAAGLGLGLLLADRLVREDARFVAASTSDFLRKLVPELESILEQREVSAEQRQALRRASDRSRVVYLSLLDPLGRPILHGREILPLAPPPRLEPGRARAPLEAAIRSRMIEVAIQPVEQAGWPRWVGDAVVPFERDGRLLGFLHVAVDLSDKVAEYRRTFLWVVVVLTALFLLAALLPGAVLWRRLKALEATAAEVRHLAFHDTLTQLPNRLLFHDRLAQAIARVHREGGKGALLMLDLDDFKEVNDAMGHAAGDQLLRVVAARLARSVRATDTVARLGGDEFALIVAPLAAVEGLDAVLARIAQELGTPIAIDGRAVTASATIGIALFPDDGDEPDRLVRRADVALYRGKARGRGSVVWHVEPERTRPAEGGPR